MTQRSGSARSAWIDPIVRLSLWVLVVAGCGADERIFESTATYEPPVEHRIVVETVVRLPFDRAWDAMIRRLSESAFRVATLEKASRLVEVELDLASDRATTANRSARYVDCGRTVRTFLGSGVPDGEGEERFEYEVVESSRHRESDPTEEGFRVSEVERRVDLATRAKVYLQPEGPDRTRVTVNALYTVEIEISGSAVVYASDPELEPSAPQSFGPRRESIRFTTFKPGEDQRRGGLTCRATGEFEHALIALANPAAAI